jgi:hypothetical protein
LNTREEKGMTLEEAREISAALPILTRAACSSSAASATTSPVPSGGEAREPWESATATSAAASLIGAG